jgi:hypothetical protein
MRRAAACRGMCISRTIYLGGGAEQLFLIGLLPELRKHGYECNIIGGSVARRPMGPGGGPVIVERDKPPTLRSGTIRALRSAFG